MSAPEIWIDQSGFSRREKLYCPEFVVSQQEKHWSRTTFHTGNGIKYARKGIFNSKKPYQIAKSENYETFWASKLLIWPQRQTTRS